MKNVRFSNGRSPQCHWVADLCTVPFRHRTVRSSNTTIGCERPLRDHLWPRSGQSPDSPLDSSRLCSSQSDIPRFGESRHTAESRQTHFTVATVTTVSLTDTANTDRCHRPDTSALPCTGNRAAVAPDRVDVEWHLLVSKEAQPRTDRLRPRLCTSGRPNPARQGAALTTRCRRRPLRAEPRSLPGHLDRRIARTVHLIHANYRRSSQTAARLAPRRRQCGGRLAMGL